MNFRRAFFLVMTVCVLLPDAMRHSTAAVERVKPATSRVETSVDPEASTEATIIGRIKELTQPDRTLYPPEADGVVRMLQKQDALELIEKLLTQYPETSFRDDALALKLSICAELARVRAEYLELLLAMTREIAAGHPSKRLAAENDFYAIQAFVLAARNEGMPEDRRRFGTAERYRAFLTDHPESPRRPIVYASLIRVLVQQDQHAEARMLLEQFRREYPQDPALRRAEGEIARVEAVGKPFDIAYLAAPDGKIATDALVGKVLVLHFWASWSEPSTELVTELRLLYDLYGPVNLAIVGVNLDTDRRALDKALERLRMPWPQFSDLKGFKSDIVVGSGVITLPTVLIVDRGGILRAVSDGRDLREALHKLMPPKDSD